MLPRSYCLKGKLKLLPHTQRCRIPTRRAGEPMGDSQQERGTTDRVLEPYGENDPQNTVTVQDVSHDDEYWQGIKYTVEDGDVIQFGE